MAVIPPWLNLDPLAPARIRLAANAQRNQAAASERAAQAQANSQALDLQFRREQAQAQQAQESEREASQERSALRRDQVLRQSHEREIAQSAQQMQFRREVQAQKAEQFQQNLRLKQQSAEAEAKSAAQQMQGMQAVQKGLKEGQPLQKLISENAPMLFAKHPERMPSAVPKGVTGPPDLTARELMNEDGTGTGVKVRAGARGSVVPLPRTTMSPEGMLRADQLRIGIISRQLEEETDPAKAAKLTQARDGIMARLEQITSGRGAVKPAAASAPKTVRVKSPSGKIREVPVEVWEETSDEDRDGFDVVSEEEE